jgi:uncharacterized repeat protein (TIGR01451 family)
MRWEMSKQFNVSYLISALLSTQPEKLLTRPTRLMLTVLCGFVLISLWQLVMAPPIHSHVVTVTDGPLCILADLEVAKTVNNATPNEGDTIIYTITVTNNGPDDATGVQLTDVLPTGLTFGGYTATQGTYNGTTGLWTVGNLDNTARATLTITATVDSGTCGMTITNTASVTANQSDPNPDNNEDSVAITVSCADLEVAKTVNNATPNVSDAIAYTITVTDNGPDDATGVQITDKLPTGLIFGGYTATQGTYNSTTGLWKGGNVANTASATLTITATVDSGTGGRTITNTAHSLTADQPDLNPDNNEASAVITPTLAVYGLYLPIICRNYEPIICKPYFDDFSDHNSGWPIDANGTVQTGYSAGEYFIHRQKQGMRIVQAPASFANRYTVEVDARWDNAKIGYEYGLIFGQTGFPYPTYRFGVHSINQQYTLRYNPGNGWQCITQPCWIDPPIPNPINRGSNSNHLKVECDRETVSLYINNNLLWRDTSYSCRGQVGLFAQSSPTTPNALAYFDNFQVSCPFGISSFNIIESNMSPVSPMSMDFEFDE